MLQVHWLLQKIERAIFHRGYGFLDRPIRRQQEHRYRGIRLLGLAQNVQPRSPRHLQVRDHHQVSSRAHLLNRRRAIRRFVHRIACALQRLAQHRAQFRLVFNKQERFHLFRFYHESRDPHRTTTRTCAEKGSSSCAPSSRRRTSTESLVLESKNLPNKLQLMTYDFVFLTAPTPDPRPIFSVDSQGRSAPASTAPLHFSWRRSSR